MVGIIKLDCGATREITEEQRELFTLITKKNFELKNCSTKVLDKILEFSDIYSESMKSEKNIYDEPKKILNYESTSTWYEEFFDIPCEELIMLANTCHNMGFKVLSNIVCYRLAKMIEGKNSKEISDVFGLSNDAPDSRSLKDGW